MAPPTSGSGEKPAASPLKDTLSHLHSLSDIAAAGGVDGIAAALGSSLSNGLPASRIAANREAYGRNRLEDRASRSFWSHLGEALEDDTLRILLASAFFSILFAAFFSTNSFVDAVQGGAIVAAAVIVSGVNSFQNWSKDREFKALAELKRDFKCHVVRDGSTLSISVYDLVVGDLLKVTAGDRLPCDGILLDAFQLEINQSSMTGESLLVKKSVEVDPFIIGGCMAQQGEGTYLATAVGAASKMGQTVSLVENEEVGNTPLQDKLEELAGDIGRLGMGVGTLTFLVLTVLWLYALEGEDKWTNLLAWSTASTVLRFFIVGLAIVVVAVPEGLPLAVTISLAFSMRRMMKDNNLVRQLQACETMGSATVIASDKTGTLTENRMSVVAGWAYGHSMDATNLSQIGSLIGNAGAVHRLAMAMALNSTAGLKITHATVEFLGNPTEAALLLLLFRDLGVDYSKERADAGKPLARRPFDTSYKYMSSIYPPESGKKTDGPILYVKGAPEIVLEMCTSTQQPSGTVNAITPEVRFNLQEQVLAMARRGLRTLAVAYRRLPPNAGLTLTGKSESEKAKAYGSLLAVPPFVPGTNNGDEASASPRAPSTSLEGELILLGLFGLADPLREGVTEALAKCNQAGIRVMMVTGDHRDTAAHIAQQCGILQPGLLVLEGPVFRAMSDEERTEACKHLAVLARSSPTDKHLLVRTLKDMGEVVAVTGDGTNDAPALRVADVGLAMGIAGTEVAKEASDIVILDDRFSSIVASVRWGRSIKENIRKFLTFQLTINIVALTLTFVTACANGGDTETNFPITPVQLLWINLIMDSFAALALATEPPSERLMEYAPQGKEEKLITPTMFKNMIGHAVFQTALLLVLIMAPEYRDRLFDVSPDIKYPNTTVFNTFVALQVFNLFNCRTVHDEWNVLADFGDSIIGQAIIGLICVMQLVLVQFGGDFFQTSPLTAAQWGRCIAIGFASVPVGYLLKLVPACDRQLRKLAPGTHRTPAGLLYGEAPHNRGAILRTITETATAFESTRSELAAQTSTIVAEVAAEEDEMMAGLADKSGETPSRRASGKAGRRDSRSSSAAAAEAAVDLDSLVASGNAEDGESRARRTLRSRKAAAPSPSPPRSGKGTGGDAAPASASSRRKGRKD